MRNPPGGGRAKFQNLMILCPRITKTVSCKVKKTSSDPTDRRAVHSAESKTGASIVQARTKRCWCIACMANTTRDLEGAAMVTHGGVHTVGHSTKKARGLRCGIARRKGARSTSDKGSSRRVREGAQYMVPEAQSTHGTGGA